MWDLRRLGIRPVSPAYRRQKRLRFNPWVREIPWRRKWQSNPVFWPGESHEQRRPVGYSPRGCKKSDTTEHTHAYTHTRKTPLLLLKSEKKNFKQLLFLLCFFPDYTHLKVLPTFRNLSCISFLLVLAIPFCPVTQTASRPSP